MRNRHRAVILAALVFFTVIPSVASAQLDVTGRWESVGMLPYFPVHVHLLPTGKVMIWPGDASSGGVSGDDPRVWDPATGTVTGNVSPLAKPGFDTFCTGHTFLADGQLLVAGGHILNGVGLKRASRYNPFTGVWTTLPDMNAGRWYPTATTLANGDVLVVSGNIDNTLNINPLPQVFQVATGTWRDLTDAQLGLEYYPTMLLAPDGRVFSAGPSTATRLLDTSGTGAWTFVGHRNGAYRDYGSAVMYADGKVLTMGGSDPPTNTAEVIDLNQPAPAWRFTASMRFARRHLNALLLPDGKVLVTGGTSGPGANDPTQPIFPAELWDPATESWTTLASASVPRLYHSTTLLLPDGRVLSMGGNGYPDTEIFSPPYLFKGVRPTITSAPTNVGYGQSFFVGTPDTSSITKVTMLRLSSTTHAFNMNQRIKQLAFSAASGGLNATAPANGNLAPPGHYLLFILNGNGVPSVAKIVQLGSGGAPPPPPPVQGPTLSSLSPTSAAAGGPAFTLTVNGTNFVNGAVVNWNGNARATTLVSGTQLTAAIAAGDIATAGTPQVTVTTSAGTSNAQTFAVNAPALSSLSPSSATAGGPAFTLTVNGTNFVNGSAVRWNGAVRTTTFVSGTRLTAAIPATDISGQGTPAVTVANPGGATSGPLTFTVTGTGTGPAPTLSSLSPSSATAGGPAFTLTVNGTNFVNGAVVRWNNAPRTTTFLSGTQLTAAIPAADVASQGTPAVTVANPDGQTSNALTLTVNAATTFSLTVSKSGPGTVTSDLAGINCGNDCSELYSAGTRVILTAAANNRNQQTVAWGGACQGTTTSSCTVTMDAAKNVTVRFR
jgi:Domain of unknown function (DUF1929)